MIAVLDDYDWKEAFAYAVPDKVIGSVVSNAACLIDDVVEIYGISAGENDGPEWVVCGLMKDGRSFVLRAGCDYTGWDCQAGGDCEVAATREEIITFGCTEEERRRMGLLLADEKPLGELPVPTDREI